MAAYSEDCKLVSFWVLLFDVDLSEVFACYAHCVCAFRRTASVLEARVVALMLAKPVVLTVLVALQRWGG